MAATLAEGETCSRTAPASPKYPTSPSCSTRWAQRSKARAPPPSGSRRRQAPRRAPSHQPRPHRSRHLPHRRSHHRRRPQCHRLQPRPPRCPHRQARTVRRQTRRRQGKHPRPLRRCAQGRRHLHGGIPGFPTDMQAQFMALATQATAPPPSPKTSSKTASCTCRNSTAWARTSPCRAAPPPSRPHRTRVRRRHVLDLRASASLVLAALVADGETILDRVYHSTAATNTSKKNSATSAPNPPHGRRLQQKVSCYSIPLALPAMWTLPSRGKPCHGAALGGEGAGGVTLGVGGSALDRQLVTATVAETASAKMEMRRAILAIA